MPASVITAVPIGVEDARLDPAQVRPDALLLPLDYATSVGAEIAAAAHLYADDVGQLLRYREAGAFPGYPDPAGFCGAAIRAPRPDGVVVCQNLGNGAADLVFADQLRRVGACSRHRRSASPVGREPRLAQRPERGHGDDHDHGQRPEVGDGEREEASRRLRSQHGQVCAAE